MIQFFILISILSLAVSIAAGIGLHRVERGLDDLQESQSGLDSSLSDLGLMLADAKIQIENMRATAGPLPPVLMRRPDWSQREAGLELQPSESAAILARLESAESVIALMEDRIVTIRNSQDVRRVEAKITAAVVEIQRHMTARRADFEMQALSRIEYCEAHVDHVTNRFNEAELNSFVKKP